MSELRQQFPYSIYTTVKAYTEFPGPADLYPGVAYIVKPSGGNFDNCLAISKGGSDQFAYDYYAPITGWQVMIPMDTGETIEAEYDDSIGWIIAGGSVPIDEIVISNQSVDLIPTSVTYWVPVHRNFILVETLDLDGTLLLDGTAAFV